MLFHGADPLPKTPFFFPFILPALFFYFLCYFYQKEGKFDRHKELNRLQSVSVCVRTLDIRSILFIVLTGSLFSLSKNIGDFPYIDFRLLISLSQTIQPTSPSCLQNGSCSSFFPPVSPIRGVVGFYQLFCCRGSPLSISVLLSCWP